MSDSPSVLKALRKYSYSLQVFGVALAFVIVSILLLLIVGELRDEVDDASRVTAMVLFILGLISFNVYVNVLKLRRMFPVNWICCCSIALLLALGHACLLGAQDGDDLVWAVEVLALMCLYILLGLWLPPQCSPLLYIATWFIVVVVVTSCFIVVHQYNCDDCDTPAGIIHGLMVVVMCPVMIFQAQVLHGHLQSMRPVLDIPLCSVVLLIDFLACYIYLTSMDDIIMSSDLLSSSNRKLIRDASSFY
ncbi:LOW QUALITY PROTEIN: uncharacterized protein LOC132789707 [Drosophila nasuta]|uniref:Uncharacterized protein LOC127565227 n=1 Tax=Drosophila albomicans TaxID=7291 RepID=A0A9C6SZK6_DROAB|nr:uncharacterized protein LOC127565227 [Drosophila albomicans]XP_060653901.1 LOW QUALITY PROTEIN: uncharacterized protein LOC132789707 [Drosophila nasuta]